MTDGYDWSPDKEAANRDKHGVEFAAIAAFEWETALVRVDDRRDYGERRQIGLGLIGTRVHVVILTDRSGVRRLISLRRANARETRFYEEETRHDPTD